MERTFLNPLHLLSSQPTPWAGWAYILLALLVAVEGPLATLAAAVTASTGFLNPILVFISASLGNLIADTLWYTLGYFGKIEWMLHYVGKFSIKENSLIRLQKDIHTHINKVLFIAKLTLGLVIPTLIAAGLARVPIKRWFATLAAAEFLWTGGLVLIGYYFGFMVQRVETNLRWISLGGIVVVLGLVIYLIAYYRPKLEQD